MGQHHPQPGDLSLTPKKISEGCPPDESPQSDRPTGPVSPTPQSRGAVAGETWPRDPDDWPICFRHGGWQPLRNRTVRAMQSLGYSQDRIDRFRKCGSAAWVYRLPTDPPEYVVHGSYCHDRWCLPCQQRRARQIAATVEQLCERRTVRFITLTLRSSHQALPSQISRLFGSFRRLRQTTLWRTNVRGGVAFLELTYNADRQQWHPHFHVLTVGRFLPYDDLRTAWHTVTGDSHVVDIRLARRPRDVLRYVVGYVTKAVKPSITRDAHRFQQAMAALSGRTMATTFGEFRGTPLRTPDEAPLGEPVCSLVDLIRAAQGHDPWAMKTLNALRRRNLKCREPPGLD